MLFLFFGLLPKAFRPQVQSMSLFCVFNKSSFGDCCKERFTPDEFSSLRSAVVQLLHSLWCQTTVPLPMEEYLRKAKNILDKVYSRADLSSSATILSAYLKLIPTAFRDATCTLAADREATINVQKMKAADKLNQGEASVDMARFKLLMPQVEPKGDSAKSLISLDQPIHLKRKSEGSHAESKVMQKPFPSNQKKACISTKASRTTSYPEITSTSIASILQRVESDVFVQRTSISQSIKTNAPNNMQCPICSNTSESPCLANCGHTACLPCWMRWLKRSQTCMVCRVKTSLDSLARVVYERRPGLSTSPSQLCAANSDDDSADELEICE